MSYTPPPDYMLTDDDIIKHIGNTYPQYEALSRQAKATGDYFIAVGRQAEAAPYLERFKTYAKIAAAEWRVLQVLEVLRDSGGLVGGVPESDPIFRPAQEDSEPVSGDSDEGSGMDLEDLL